MNEQREAPPQSTTTPQKLSIPRTDEEAADVPGFATKAAFVMGVMAEVDGAVTTEEYIALSHAAEALAKVSDNPVLIRVSILRGALSNVEFGAALKELRGCEKDAPQEFRTALFQATAPLMACQKSKAREYCRQWAKVLKIPDALAEEVASLMPEKESTDLFQSLFGVFSKSPDTRLVHASKIAKLFQDQPLLELLQRIEQQGLTETEAAELETMLTDARTRALEIARSVLPTKDSLDATLELTDKYSKLATAFAQQIELRLRAVDARLQLDQTMFEEDLANFINAATDKVELAMREMLAGKTKALTDEDLWKHFAESELPTLVREMYEPLRKRNTRLMEHWNQELSNFSHEVLSTASSVLETVPQEAFRNLLDTSVKSEKYLELLDKSAEAVSSTMSLGSSVLIATGSLSAVAMLVVGSPVAAVIGAGAVGGLLLYKHFLSDIEQRKHGRIDAKAESFRSKLVALVGDPLTEMIHDMDQVRGTFAAKANEVYGPMVRDLRLVGYQVRLQKQIIERVFNDTHACFTPQ